MSVASLERFVPPDEVGLPAGTPQPVVAEVQAYQEEVAASTAATLATVLAIWVTIDLANPVEWFFGIAEELFVAVSLGQSGAASTGRRYVQRSLAAQGRLASVPQLRPDAFAGHASDGRELDGLLEQSLWATWRAQAEGRSDAEVKAAGAATLSAIVATQIPDAAREAASAVITDAEVLQLSPRALQPGPAGAAVRDAEIRALIPERHDPAQTLVDVDRILADPVLADRVQRRAELEQTRAQERAARAASRAEDALREAQRDAATGDVVREAERILAEANARQAALDAERARQRGVAATTRPGSRSPIGWIRVLTPPSCGRCVVLAGKWYGWNQGFERHENCDCRHLPAVETDSTDLIANPDAYFESLTPEEQDEAFGQANAEAIRAGGDLTRIINATRKGSVFTVDGRNYTRAGTSKRGDYRGSDAQKARSLRATPATLIREAKGDRAEAARLLRRFGYIA